MIISNNIKELTKEITNLHLTNGVQPNELTEAIFEKDYDSMLTKKIGNTVITEVCFFEIDEGLKTEIKVRYTYSFDAKLQTIEQKIGKGRYKIQWDREVKINSLFDQLVTSLSKINDESAVKAFIKKIPIELKKPFFEKFKISA